MLKVAFAREHGMQLVCAPHPYLCQNCVHNMPSDLGLVIRAVVLTVPRICVNILVRWETVRRVTMDCCAHTL
jgi:hypothetical protein